MADIKEVLEKELRVIKPSSDELIRINGVIHNFLSLIKPELKKVNADIIVGGSFAKNTVIKKKKYDADFFVRFDYSKYHENSQEISSILEKILHKAVKSIKAKPALKLEKIRGSRDYFRINLQTILFEIVPVLRILKSSQAVNVTDASPLHVKYIKGKIGKNKKLADEIRLVKAFCYANGCYGAESYINGFSGYALELLTCYYGSFIALIKAASKWDADKKIVIDAAKFYKKNNALNELNEAKIQSPLVLIDPTQKDRNATASLSAECFNSFIKSCKSFLRHPSGSFFMKSEYEIDREKLKKDAKSKKAELVLLEVKSNKNREDVAGAKLLKLFRILIREFSKDFSVLKSEWHFYEDARKAVFVFILLKKKDILARGPPVALEKYCNEFRKKWKKCFVKDNSLCALRKPRDIKEILKIKDMDEIGIRSINMLK